MKRLTVVMFPERAGMTLNEALAIINRGRNIAAKQSIYLACGFQPLHLATFLRAHAIQRFEGATVEVRNGLYGDLAGNLEKARQSGAGAIAAVIEWDDLDPRLGLRANGGWSAAAREDIEKTCAQRFGYFASLLEQLPAVAPVVVAGPSLPLPPLGHTVQRQASSFELGLYCQAAAFAKTMSEVAGVRVVHPAWLDAASLPTARLDSKMQLLAGFPYSASHADILAGALVDLLYPRAAKKGLIVDLDDTLWSGIVGEAGADGVSWHQESHTQVHALLQQMLEQMAENGVLLAIASKNEPQTVRKALARSDLLVRQEAFFPVIASWGPKSAAVDEILRAWNVGADSVVFLDDNPMELSEVEAAHPGVTGLRFNAKDPAAVWDLLLQLRDLFGKPAVFEEDKLRRDSIRSAVALQNLGRQADSAGFLQTLGGRLTIDYRKDPADKRPLELINKTNQFNLNGVRITEGDWLAGLRDDSTIAAVVSYEDKFGSLGKIAVLLGRNAGRHIVVTSWVMSCRAFSRKIEHHTLDSLFRLNGVEQLLFDFRPTERNQPLQQFFEQIGASCRESGQLRLTREKFLEARQDLPHEVMESPI